MSTKTYRAASLEECFVKVKTEMGGDAIILTSRAFQPIFGKFGKTTHEVTATLDESYAAQLAARPPMTSATRAQASSGRGVYGYSRGNKERENANQPGGRQQAATLNKLKLVDLGPARAIEIAEARAAELHDTDRRTIEVRGLPEGRRIEIRGEDKISGESHRHPGIGGSVSLRDFTPAIDDTDSTTQRLARLEKQVAEMSSGFQTIKEAVASRGKATKTGQAVIATTDAANQATPRYAALRRQLTESGMAAALVRRLVDELAPGLTTAQSTDALRTDIAARMMLAGGLEVIRGKTQSVAFMGPSGVGKTTTLAKLAAQLTLVGRHKVAIVNMDTQRVAASRQIEMFGEILRVPVKTAYDADELAQHHQELADQGYDFVLIDTPGRSPNDSIAIGEVARSLKALPLLTKYLVLPATLSGANHEYVTGKFYSLASPDAVIVSKCDESSDYSHVAHLLMAQAKFNIPVAYLASGTRVPDDLAPANPHIMAEKLLG